MDDCLRQCIDRYCELATQSNGKPVVLNTAATPFLGYHEQNSSPQGGPAPGDLANAHTCPYCFNFFEPSADTRGDRAKEMRTNNLEAKAIPRRPPTKKHSCTGLSHTLKTGS